MKDNNLEQQLADKLGSRSIAPSEQAWERIARNRQQGRQKQKNRKRMFVYYAASIAVVLFAGYLFMNSTTDAISEPQVVDKTEKPTVITRQAVAEAGVLPQEDAMPLNYKENAVPGVGLPAYEQEVTITAALDNQPHVNESIAQLSASVLPQAKTVTKDKLYDEEVDYLLKEAIKQVAADKHLSKPTDNTALLKEVEAEMDEYYRDKAMSIFSLKHKKIRIAVRE